MKQTNVDDLVIKVLGHSERREILRILESSPEGVKYSSILEDTGLSTSKLNYQLNELQEFIQKNDEGLYYLTPLGGKAVNILDNINKSLRNDLGLTSKSENQRRKFIQKQLNNLFYILVTSFAIGVVTLTYFYFADPSSGITTPVLGVAYIVFAAIFYALNHLRKKSPRYFLGFIDWLDWKFFNGKGSDDFRGKKIFVLTVLGFIIGALVGKAGLGLIIGLFLGAATEY